MYKCNKCNKIFTYISELNRHKSRKFPCKKLEISSQNFQCSKCYRIFASKYSLDRHLTDSCNETKNLNKNFLTKIENSSQIFECSKCNETFTSNNDLNHHYINSCKPKIKSLTKSLTKYKNNENQYTCQHCHSIFSRKDNLLRHIEKYCKNKDEDKPDLNQEKIDQMQELIVKLSEELSIAKQSRINIPNSVNVNSNNINSNNQTVNIQLVAFGKEDRSKLTDLEILKIMKKGYYSVPELLKLINFDKEKPENHNMYISNLKSDNVHVFDGEKWKSVNRTETIDNLFDDGRNFLLNKVEELNERNPPLGDITKNLVIKFERCNDEIDELPDKKREVFKCIRDLLYNERKMIQNSKKFHEAQQYIVYHN